MKYHLFTQLHVEMPPGFDAVLLNDGNDKPSRLVVTATLQSHYAEVIKAAQAVMNKYDGDSCSVADCEREFCSLARLLTPEAIAKGTTPV